MLPLLNLDPPNIDPIELHHPFQLRPPPPSLLLIHLHRQGPYSLDQPLQRQIIPCIRTHGLDTEGVILVAIVEHDPIRGLGFGVAVGGVGEQVDDGVDETEVGEYGAVGGVVEADVETTASYLRRRNHRIKLLSICQGTFDRSKTQRLSINSCSERGARILSALIVLFEGFLQGPDHAFGLVPRRSGRADGLQKKIIRLWETYLAWQVQIPSVDADSGDVDDDPKPDAELVEIAGTGDVFEFDGEARRRVFWPPWWQGSRSGLVLEVSHTGQLGSPSCVHKGVRHADSGRTDLSRYEHPHCRDKVEDCQRVAKRSLLAFARQDCEHRGHREANMRPVGRASP